MVSNFLNCKSNMFIIFKNVNLNGQDLRISLNPKDMLTLGLSCFQVEKTRNFVSRSLVIGEVLSIADMATGVKVKVTGSPTLHVLRVLFYFAIFFIYLAALRLSCGVRDLIP